MSISKLNSDLRTVFRYDAQITRIPCLPDERGSPGPFERVLRLFGLRPYRCQERDITYLKNFGNARHSVIEVSTKTIWFLPYY
jgi:hypothetical protein